MNQKIDMICLFEDYQYANFKPLVNFRPVFDLLLGTCTLKRKYEHIFKKIEIIYFLRNELKDAFLEKNPETTVNAIPENAEEILFINGRIDVLTLKPQDLKGDFIFTDENDQIAAFRLKKAEFGLFAEPGVFENNLLSKIKKIKVNKRIGVKVLNFPWDMIRKNGEYIKQEYEKIYRNIENSDVRGLDYKVLGEKYYISPKVSIEPYVLIDTRSGPVIIEDNVYISPFTYIQGPCYIGPGTRIYNGKIRPGNSFGESCRVGGELEDSILIGFVNKYHAGFLGHSIVGEWVNLGALTTNSDLKNNYSNVRVKLNGEVHDTGTIKFGCVLGDYTKTGIGTLINTGSVIGSICNLYGGELFSGEIPDLSWGTSNNIIEYRIDKAIETIKASMSRRDRQLTPVKEKLIRSISKVTKNI